MPMRSAGTASNRAPTPPAQMDRSKPQPSGTASTKRIERFKPRLAASAVESVVLGPGVKLATLARTSRAVNSVLFMGWSFAGL